ncbi:MAG: hypothetical protein K6A44_06925 [bacterium]|nr:hypothetical protein [bacterium]
MSTPNVELRNFDSEIKISNQQEAAKKAEEAKKQQQEKATNDAIRKWTGIDNEQSGMTYVGQCLAAPITVTANAGGGILSGLFSALGGILSPIAGFLGGIFGGGNAQGGPQGPGNCPAPAGNNSGAAKNDSTSSTKNSSSENKKADNTTNNTTTSNNSGTTKSGSSNNSVSAINDTSGTVNKVLDAKSGTMVSSLNTGGAEKVSSRVRALVEEYNDSTKYTDECQTEFDNATKELEEFKKSKPNVNADAQAKLKEEIAQHDKTIDSLSAQYGNVQKDIQGQQALLEKCDDSQKASINTTIQELQAELRRLEGEIQKERTAKATAEQQYKTNGGDKAISQDADSRKLGELEAKVNTAKSKLEAAQRLQNDNKTAAEAAANEVRNDKNLDIDKAREQVNEDNKILNKAESEAQSSSRAQLERAFGAVSAAKPEIELSADGKTSKGKLADGTEVTITTNPDGSCTAKTADGTTTQVKYENGKWVEVDTKRDKAAAPAGKPEEKPADAAPAAKNPS